jgi:hypothetical protein
MMSPGMKNIKLVNLVNEYVHVFPPCVSRFFIDTHKEEREICFLRTQIISDILYIEDLGISMLINDSPTREGGRWGRGWGRGWLPAGAKLGFLLLQCVKDSRCLVCFSFLVRPVHDGWMLPTEGLRRLRGEVVAAKASQQPLLPTNCVRWRCTVDAMVLMR